MRHAAVLREGLADKFPRDLLDDLLQTFSEATQKYNAGDYATCLTKAGLFAENVLRALLWAATGVMPTEIRNFSDAVSTLKKADLPESLAILVPKVVSACVYEMRSKKGAVHVKGVSPLRRDATLAIGAMQWTLAELLNEYGNLSERALETSIASLMRRQMPFIDYVGGQPLVTVRLPVYKELLLLIDGHPEGISRREIGRLAKASASAITHALTKLSKERMAQSVAGLWFISQTGEKELDTLF